MRKFILLIAVILLSNQSLFSQVPSYVPSNGLVGFWPFSGNANDASGNGNNGTVNGASLTTDRNGVANSAYNFSGGSNISIPMTSVLHNLPNRTFSCWYFANGSQSGGRIFETTYPKGGIAIYNSNTLDAWYNNGTNECNVTNINSGTLNQWHNLVYVTNSAGMGTIYIDGILINSRNGALQTASTNWLNNFLRFGIGSQGESFNGKLDDIGIWNRALTPQEVTALYTSCTTPAPTGALTQTFCATPAPTLASLTATGTGIQWYAVANGGTALATTTALVNATTYYASQTVSGCESTTRLAVTVTLNDPQITASATTVCSGTPVNLSASTTATVAQNGNLPINLQNGLIGYFPFTGNANDESGNGHNANVNGATLTLDRFGNANSAYMFNANSSIIPTNRVQNVINTFSYSAWVNPNSTCIVPNQSQTSGAASNLTGNQCVIHPIHGQSFNNYITNAGSGLYVGTNGLYVEEHTGGWEAVPLSYNGNLIGWHLITIVYESKIPKLYIDGNYISTGIPSALDIHISLGPDDFPTYFNSGIGAGYFPASGTSQYFNGKIDDTSFWNRALSQSEITQLYNSNQATYLWSTGETTATINPTPTATTTYWCDVTVNGVTCRKSVTVTVNPNINPAFTQVAAICNGATLAALPTTSTNNITGSWSPALNNTATTTYTFTPTAGQCATTATMTITVNPIPPAPTGSLTQTFCATPAPTLASLTATGTGIQWYAVANGGTALATTTALVNATTYYASQTVSGCESTTRLAVTVTLNDPQITASATTVCSGTPVNLTASTTATVAQNCNLPANLQTGLVGYWPFCGNANDVSGNANNGTVNGATLTTDRFGNANSAYSFDGNDFISTQINRGALGNLMTISAFYKFTGIININHSAIIGSSNTIGTDFFIGKNNFDTNIGVQDGNYNHQFVVGSNAFDGNWHNIIYTFENNTGKIYLDGILKNTGNFSKCKNSDLLNIGTEFEGSGYYFYGPIDDVGFWNRVLSQSEITQLYNSNQATYLWSTGETTATINPTPAATTTYWCDVTVNGVTCRKTMTISVNPIINPAFTQVAAICNGATLAALPIRSTNGITGTWLPAINNTATTTYTFTPTAGQCATTATMTITVNPNIAPTFTQVATICAGATLAVLPTTSNNGITGTWLPAINNTATTTYTFTPTAGLCATTATMTITVNPLPLPPTATITQTFCANIYPTLQNIVVTPSNIKWYSSLTSATPLPITTALPVGATTYYATQYNPVTGCESNGRLAVVATVLLENTPSTLTDQTFCISDLKTLSDIKTDGLNIVWYTSSTGGTPLSNNYVLTVNQTLYAAIFNAATGCESPIRQMVQITIINCQLVPNNLLTLNGNSLNDNLNIENIENFPINQIEIYNRFGEIVWKTEYYNNGSNTFLGKANVSGVYQKDTNLPTGTYYFILKYYDPYHKKYTDLKSFLYINNNN